MDIKLTDLEPEWVIATDGSHARSDQLTIVNAQGILFLDPVEFTKNGGPIGTSSVLVWFRGRGVPDDKEPRPGRWDVAGTGFDDLTLSPSIDLTVQGEFPDRWHGFIKAGRVT